MCIRDRYITEYIQFLAVGHGVKIRENLFEKPQKQWKHNACLLYISITVDGKDVRKLTLESLRNQIGLVQQDVYLF